MRRVVRYSGVSLVAFLLAQIGLLVGYGLLRWSVLPAVLLSLMVSVGPAYILNRLLVWPDGAADRANLREGAKFFLVAVVGSLISASLISGGEALARHHTSDHSTLSVVVVSISVASTGLVWLLRYVVFDRLVFRRASEAPSGSDSGRLACEASL